MKRRMMLLISLFLFLPGFFPPPVSSDENRALNFTLSNGMKVILKENHANPMIASLVYVNAGSKYETDYNNGITHLLEHLLFDGTKRRTREQITEGIKSKGGYINAFTSKELTCYIVLLPSEFIEYGMDIQSDMLFHSIFPDSELAKERKVVIEEIKKDQDNISYQVEKFFDSQVYRGTPYARPVIGYQNIIATLSKEQIKDYYSTYYKPNNMIAMLIGDFEPEKMLELLEIYFGEIPPRPLPEPDKIESFPLVEKRIRYKEEKTDNAYLSLSFEAPHFTDPDFFPFDILTHYLNSEEISPIYKAILKGENPLALEFSADLEIKKEFSRLNFHLTTDSPEKVQKILKTIEDCLKKLDENTPTQEDLDRIVTSKKTKEYYIEEKLHHYPMYKASMIVNCGIEFLESYLDQLELVTPKSVRRVAEKYLSEPTYLATVVVPKKPKEEKQKEKSKSHYHKEILKNGLTVIIKENPYSEVLGINILGKNRSAFEPEGKTGITDLLNRVLLKGTEQRSGEKLVQDKERIGAEITLVDNPYIPYDDLYTTPRFSFIKFQTIDEFAEQGIELLADMIRNPALPEQQIENSKMEMIGLIKREEGNTYKSAKKLFYSELFGDHPYGKNIMGTPQTLASLTRDDLVEFHLKFYSPENMIMTIATSIDTEEILDLIKQYFGDMPKAGITFSGIPVPEQITAPKKSEKPMEKEQVYIYLGGLLPGINDTDAPALKVMNSILSSRLGQNLREKMGLAYSVGSGVSFDRDFGWYAASIGTSPKNYDQALSGIFNELKQIKNTLAKEEELEKAKNSIWGNLLFYRLTRINQAFWMGVNEFSGAGYEYDQNLIDMIQPVTREDVKRVAGKYLDTKNYVLAVVGKK